MYRIELARGEETIFRTIEELAVGIRNGLVTSRARIYHHATQKWLPIEFHPHYKKALALSTHRQDLPPAPLPERLETLSFAAPRAPTPPPPAPPAPQPTEPEPVASTPVGVAPIVAARVEPSPAERREVERAMVDPVAAERVVPERAAPGRFAAEGVVADRIAVELAGTPRLAAVRVIETPTPIRTSVRFHPPLSIEPDPLAAESAAARLELPPVVASPVLQLPAVVYPDITPAEPPVAEPVTTRSRRLRHVAGAVVVLALGGYGMMSFAPSGGRAAAAVPAVADRPVSPATTSEPAAPAAARAPALDRPAPKAIVMTQPASSGFAPALEPRAIVSTSSATAVATPLPAVARDSAVGPAPIDIQLDVPVLPGADSLVTVPPGRTDSAMKRILRAVNGGRDLPQRP